MLDQHHEWIASHMLGTFEAKLQAWKLAAEILQSECVPTAREGVRHMQALTHELPPWQQLDQLTPIGREIAYMSLTTLFMQKSLYELNSGLIHASGKSTVRTVEMLESTGDHTLVERLLPKITNSFYAMPLAAVGSYCNKMIAYYQEHGKAASKDALHFYMLCGAIYSEHQDHLTAKSYLTGALTSQDNSPSLLAQYGEADDY
jgi:hypothetical protein